MRFLTASGTSTGPAIGIYHSRAGYSIGLFEEDQAPGYIGIPFNRREVAYIFPNFELQGLIFSYSEYELLRKYSRSYLKGRMLISF